MNINLAKLLLTLSQIERNNKLLNEMNLFYRFKDGKNCDQISLSEVQSLKLKVFWTNKNAQEFKDVWRKYVNAAENENDYSKW